MVDFIFGKMRSCVMSQDVRDLCGGSWMYYDLGGVERSCASNLVGKFNNNNRRCRDLKLEFE